MPGSTKEYASRPDFLSRARRAFVPPDSGHVVVSRICRISASRWYPTHAKRYPLSYLIGCYPGSIIVRANNLACVRQTWQCTDVKTSRRERGTPLGAVTKSTC